MPVKNPWLAPLHVPPDLREKLEHEWARLNTALGTKLPKSTFVRMLLEKGLVEMSVATWAVREGEGVVEDLVARSEEGAVEP
jgi:hypothetical protein